MSTPSLARQIIKRPWLKRWALPLSNWYKDAAGYRKMGLRYVQLRTTRYPGDSTTRGSSRSSWLIVTDAEPMI